MLKSYSELNLVQFEILIIENKVLSSIQDSCRRRSTGKSDRKPTAWETKRPLEPE